MVDVPAERTWFEPIRPLGIAIGTLSAQADADIGHVVARDVTVRELTALLADWEAERWEKVVSEWGRGGGYRGRVSVRFDEWFEDPELNARVDAVQEQMTHLWRKSVVQRLETARVEARSGTRKNAAQTI